MAKAIGRTIQENPSDSPVPITSVSVEGNKSLLLLSRVQLRRLVLSAGPLSLWPLKPQWQRHELPGPYQRRPPREGSVAAGPLATPDWPLLGSPPLGLDVSFTLSASHSLPAHILAARLRLPMSRRIKLNFEAARKLLCLRRLARTRLEAGGIRLSVCLGEMLFSDLTRSSCYNKSKRQIQTALLPWHTVTLPIHMWPKLKGLFAQNSSFIHFPHSPRNRWTFHNPRIRVLKMYPAPNWRANNEKHNCLEVLGFSQISRFSTLAALTLH